MRTWPTMPAHEHSAAASPSKNSRGAYIELTQGQEEQADTVWSADEMPGNEIGELSRLSAEVSAVQRRARCLLWCTAGLVGALCMCLGVLFAAWGSMQQASEHNVMIAPASGGRASAGNIHGTLEKTMQDGAVCSKLLRNLRRHMVEAAAHAFVALLSGANVSDSATGSELFGHGCIAHEPDGSSGAVQSVDAISGKPQWQPLATSTMVVYSNSYCWLPL